MNKRFLFIWVNVAVLALSACASPATIEAPQPSSNQVETGITAVLPSSTPQPDCSGETEGVQPLSNVEMGFCLLYPEGYTEVFSEPAQICLIPGEPGEPNMACHSANAFINVEPANGRTVSEAADQIVAESSLTEKFERTSLTVDGEEAIMLDGLGGVDINRKVVIIHGERLYTLMFTPWDNTREGWAGVENLHDTIINSFTLLP